MKEKRPPEPLVARLLQLAKGDDRAALSALRRSLGQGAAARAYPYVVPFFPRQPNAWVERAYLLVAGLFALHPVPGHLSLGGALRVVGDRSGSRSVEQRFVALLDAHPEDVDQHLRHAISLVRSREIGIDWSDLLRTVRWWHEESSRRRWARDFWTRPSSDEGEAE